MGCAEEKGGIRMESFSNSFKALGKEVNQHHSLRLPLLKKIRELRDGRTIISFFISFHRDSPLSQEDADMIEEVLCNQDNTKGITLILDAPGGDGLAAERIIQICRSYSGNDFETIVPARAKSAATMVCLGSDKIIMSPTSELGPIDPQVPYDLGYGPTWVAADEIIKAYDDLFSKAVSLKDGQIAPYLQQLSTFNSVFVQTLRTATGLSKSIAIASLKRGMMKNKSESQIKKKIEPFTNIEFTKSHGRGISADDAQKCGLNIDKISPSSELWKVIWGLYLRSRYVVDMMQPQKLIETTNDSFIS